MQTGHKDSLMKFLFTIVLLSLSGCLDRKGTPGSSDGPSSPTDEEETGSPQGDTASSADTGAHTDVGIQFEIMLDPDCVVCAQVQVSLGEVAPVTLMVGETGDPLSPWAWSDGADEHQIPLIELKPDTAYDVAIRLESDPPILSDSRTFSTGSLPDHFPPITLEVHSPDQMEAGLTIMSIVEWKPAVDMDGNFLVAVNDAGEVVWYHQLTGLNVGLYVDELKRIYTTETVLAAVRLDPYGGTKTVWTAESLGIETTHHEVRPLEDGGLATITTEMRAIPGWIDEHTGWSFVFNVVGDILATFDAEGHMTWSWSLMDHFDPLEHHTDDLHMAFWTMPPYDHLDTPKDWSHGNAMVPNGGSWLASFRNLDWLIQVDPDTDEIDWIFGPGGDFNLAEGGRWFSRQHAPAVQPGGSILLYDNGNARADRVPGEQAFSRVVEYELNTESGIATELWSWDGGVPRVFCPIVGDVDQLEGGTHLITDGAVFRTTIDEDGDVVPHFSARIREVANIRTDPEIIWEIRLGADEDTETPSWVVYRAIRVDSLYPEFARPR
jgi:hypothetical protein